MTNTIDITTWTDAMVDAMLTNTFDESKLTAKQAAIVAASMGMDMGHSHTAAWLATFPATLRSTITGPDYEGRILAAQEADESRWT